MKKIFIFSTITLLFIGCNESEFINQENVDELKIETRQVSKSTENRIDTLFYNYVNSFEYKESNRLLNIFQAKFKVPVSEDDFSTISEMLHWVGLNLDKTDFNSLEEATTEWQSISNLLAANFYNNQEFFEFVRTTEKSISMPYFEKWFLKNTTEDDECSKQIKTCEMNALVAYVDAIMVYGGSTKSFEATRQAHWLYINHIRICANNFEECVANSTK